MAETNRELAIVELIQTDVCERLTAYFNENAIAVEPSFPEIDRESTVHALPFRKGAQFCGIGLPRTFPEDRVHQVKREVFDKLIGLITGTLAASSDNSILYYPRYEYEYHPASEVLDVTFHAGFVENVERVF